MKKIILLLFFYTTIFSQKKNSDYFEYHKQINKAEILFFEKGNVDSCFYYYDKTFKEFDFIFLKDLVNAAQLAKYSKLEYKKYVFRAFEQGLKIDHLELFPIFKNEISILKKDKIVQQKFSEGREKYLQKIDLDYLDKIYEIALNERHYRSLDRNKYREKLSYNFRVISSLTKQKGFPGEKQIGVADSTVFMESRSIKKDLPFRAKKYNFRDKSFNIINEGVFSQSIISTLFINLDFCFFNELDKNILLREIKKGNIHPKDIAYYNDLAFYMVKYNGLNHCGAKQAYPLFSYKLNDISDFSLIKANEIRKQFCIVPYEIDLKKEEFQVKNKITLFHWNIGYR
jgi:hypothetical protein